MRRRPQRRHAARCDRGRPLRYAASAAAGGLPRTRSRATAAIPDRTPTDPRSARSANCSRQIRRTSTACRPHAQASARSGPRASVRPRPTARQPPSGVACCAVCRVETPHVAIEHTIIARAARSAHVSVCAAPHKQRCAERDRGVPVARRRRGTGTRHSTPHRGLKVKCPQIVQARLQIVTPATTRQISDRRPAAAAASHHAPKHIHECADTYGGVACAPRGEHAATVTRLHPHPATHAVSVCARQHRTNTGQNKTGAGVRSRERTFNAYRWHQPKSRCSPPRS